MFVNIRSLGLWGLGAFPVEVETDLSPGLPGFDIVGLPDAAVKESRDRVRSALKNCGYSFPVSHITVNLAPADQKKSGPLYDLPILLGILMASGQFDAPLSDAAFLGELSLDGSVRPVSGVLPMVLAAKEQGIKTVFLPKENETEGAVVQGITVFGINHINSLISFLNGKGNLTPAKSSVPVRRDDALAPDFSDVKGQQGPRRAMEIAAAGGHNLLLIGPPGSGKSMLAKRLPSILPDMTFEESIETSKIYSVAGMLSPDDPLITVRPFRAPHHTVSSFGLAGGGAPPRPGEVSLAHNGVLFLDELPEFTRQSLEVLRQPIEDGEITVSRVGGSVTYPCTITVVAAMNPCPCGFYGHPTRRCICKKGEVQRYLSKISGPLLDRLDLHVDAMPVEYEHLSSEKPAERSAEIKKRVEKAREIGRERLKALNVFSNARIPSGKLHTLCPTTPEAERFLHTAFDHLSLSARAYDRILKISRTIADLDGTETIDTAHVAEAVQYRTLDRKYWEK